MMKLYPVNRMGMDKLFMAPEIRRYTSHATAAEQCYSIAKLFDEWLCHNMLYHTSKMQCGYATQGQR